MRTTRSVIRWVIVGRRDGVRAAIRRQTGCLTWLDRRAPPEEGLRAEVAAQVEPVPARSQPIPLIPVEEVPPGTVVEVVAGGVALAVANVDGEVIAVDGVCPHAGGPLGDGHLEGCTLTCPWHGWTYDLRTGRSLVADNVALRRYPVQVIEGMVVLIEPALASTGG